MDYFPDINLTLDALSYLTAINLSFQINFPWISISRNGVMNARNELLSLILHDLLKFTHLTKVLQSKSTSYVKCLSITDQFVSVRLNECQNVCHTVINTVSDQFHCVLEWLFLNALNGATDSMPDFSTELNSWRNGETVNIAVNPHSTAASLTTIKRVKRIN